MVAGQAVKRSAKRAITAAAPTATWDPDGERTSRRTIIWLLVCLLAFIGGVVLSQLAESPDGYMELTRKCLLDGRVAATCEQAIQQLHEGGHSFARVSLLLAMAETAKAISIAIAVSLLVSNFFERSSRERLNRMLARKTQEISTNVFDAMFGNSHPPSALEAIKRILERPLTRESLDVTYTLSLWTAPGRDGRPGTRHVKVDAVLSSVTRNIASPQTSPGASHKLKVAMSLPNPLLEELKQEMALKSVKIDGADVEPQCLEKANEALQLALRKDQDADASVEVCERTLEPGQAARIQANYTMMKELEDTEVLRSFLLTQSLKLTVIDKTGLNLRIRARAMHLSPLEKTGSDESFLSWELNDVLLPQQGIMVWWKQPLDAVGGNGAAPSQTAKTSAAQGLARPAV